MSILYVPPEGPYPPGITGDPYTPWPIDVFFDMNWPGRSGMVSKGITFEGLQGLGCVDLDIESGVCLDPPTVVIDPETGNPLLPSLTPTPIVAGGVDCTSFALTAAQAAACGGVVGPGSGGAILQGTPNQVQYTPAQLAAIIAAGGSSAVSIIRTAAGGPYTVAGTNLVYNPATGQLTTSAGANASALASSLTSYLPMIGLALAAVLIVPALFGKK